MKFLENKSKFQTQIWSDFLQLILKIEILINCIEVQFFIRVFKNLVEVFLKLILLKKEKKYPSIYVLAVDVLSASHPNDLRASTQATSKLQIKSLCNESPSLCFASASTCRIDEWWSQLSSKAIIILMLNRHAVFFLIRLGFACKNEEN